MEYVKNLWRYPAVLVVIFVVACAVRLAYVGARYTPDLSSFQDGDYRLYEIGAEHIEQYGRFDNSLFLVRPPAFPILIYLLGLNGTAVLIANVIMGALIAPLTYVLARQWGLAANLSLAAGLIAALDPTSIIYSAYLGSESLANLTLLAALMLLITSVRSRTRPRALPWAALAALALVVSLLARPASFLVWIVLVVWGLLSYRKQWVAVALFALICAGGIGTWIAHNGSVFGNPTFSTIGVYNLLYYRAASVESRGANLPIEDTYVELSRRVEARLGHDTSTVDGATRHGHYAATADLQTAMTGVALDVFTTYPVVYLLTIPIGLWRILGWTQNVPGGLMIVLAVWNLGLVLAAAGGLIALFRHKQYSLFWLILLVCAYYIAGTIIVQTSGIDTRGRTMLTPLLAIGAVYGLSWIFTIRRS
ncbi:MAG: hypothetical protein IT320_09315 [Anaerolineae bacterium]|nr:hypothetical protein [Anaerolineae bacterium]